MKTTSYLIALTVVMATPALAQRRGSVQPDIYPYKPLAKEEIRQRVVRLTEEPNVRTNLHALEFLGAEGSAAQAPWGGSYWPLIQGQIANLYQDKKFWRPMGFFSWKRNVAEYNKRHKEVHPHVMNLSERDLAKLAPSEKYDLLLGDLNFDLTQRTWNFVENWGRFKKNGFLTNILYPGPDYRLPHPSDVIAQWEGICHGWALAAGGYPRPQRTVTVTLPNGKRMPFYPDDIKALISLAFANSDAQNEVLVEGYRCEDKNPDQDEFGRFIDRRTRGNDSLLPKCADVHPAVWHLAVVELMGRQRRSIVVELDANRNVNNHPLASYSFRYFNPARGSRGTLQRSMLAVERYRNDPYKSSRHPEASFVVGVEMKVKYVDWARGNNRTTNTARNDKTKRKTYLYDLELDAQGNVIGGQWRVTHTVLDFDNRSTTGQPDFFWSLRKDYMKHFQPDHSLEPWRGGTPPESWRAAAHASHANVLREGGPGVNCKVINDHTRDVQEVPCEFSHPKPRPLMNVVQRLMELSK